MTLKYTNTERTSATFNGASFSMSAADDWDSIGDGPTREAVKEWLAEGNLPLPVDPPTIAELNAPILAEIAAEEAKQNRAVREALLLLLPAGAEKDRLKAIDDNIKAARLRLKK
jgi:hypothetical protein